MNQKHEEEGQRGRGAGMEGERGKGDSRMRVGLEDQCHPRAGSMPGGRRLLQASSSHPPPAQLLPSTRL